MGWIEGQIAAQLGISGDADPTSELAATQREMMATKRAEVTLNAHAIYAAAARPIREGNVLMFGEWLLEQHDRCRLDIVGHLAYDFAAVTPEEVENYKASVPFCDETYDECCKSLLEMRKEYSILDVAQELLEYGVPEGAINTLRWAIVEYQLQL